MERGPASSDALRSDRRALLGAPSVAVAIVALGALTLLSSRAHGQEASALGSAPVADVVGTDDPAGVAATPGDVGHPTDNAPITAEARAEQRMAGVFGLSVWTVVGIATGLWLALRWRRTRRG